MTNKEQTEAILRGQERFYAWEPPGRPDKTFRCWHIEPYARMTEAQCRARATKPEIYENAGCSNRCPRWRHYRKLATDDGIERRAYPPHRRIP